jgi:hypothetical protein
MNTDQQVIFIIILLTVATVVTLVVWYRAYKRNTYIERTGHDYDGSVYTRKD